MAYESLFAFVLGLGTLVMIAQLVLSVLRTLAIIKIRNEIVPKPLKEGDKVKIEKE